MNKEYYTALIYAQSGGGKTVNSTLIPTGERNKNLLMCSDNSSIVLNNFERPNLEEQTIRCFLDNGKPYFIEMLNRNIESNKYDNIIIDNISDIFDMAILDYEESGEYKDMRKAYLIVYNALKRAARKAANAKCNIIFTAWEDLIEITDKSGKKAYRHQPKLPLKILDNFCGLMNVVARVDSKENSKGIRTWYYQLEGTSLRYGKDQLFCRKSCMPEDIFVNKKTA